MLGTKATKSIQFLVLIIALAFGLAVVSAAAADEGQPTITTPAASAPTGAAGLNAAAVLGGMPVCGDQSVPGTVRLNCPDFTQVDVESYQVPGIVGANVDVNGNYVFEEAAIPGWVEVYVVDDANGTINGVKPGTSGWAAQVASRNPRFLFGVGSTPFTPDVTLQFHGGDFLGFRYTNSFRNLFYSFRAANGGTIRMRAFQHTSGQPWQFAWEDGADNDYNDMVVNLSAAGDTTPPPDTTPPTVSITSPVDGAEVTDTIPMTADASDDVGVAGVQFQLDGQNLGDEQTASPYSVPWDTTQATDGQHTLTAVARDTAGNLSAMASVTVIVANSVLNGNGDEGTSDTFAAESPPSTCAGTTASSDPSTAVPAAPSHCTTSNWCSSSNQAVSNIRTRDEKPIEYHNRLTGLTYWRASASVQACVNLKKGVVTDIKESSARVTPLYALHVGPVPVWSYGNSPHWSYGPTSTKTTTTSAEVTDSYTGCPFGIPIGCNKVTFTVHFEIYGNGTYRYSLKYEGA